jgi:DNA-binding NarL/FixJ family response regulator
MTAPGSGFATRAGPTPVGTAVIPAPSRLRGTTIGQRLSRRQRDMLVAAAAGLCDKEIAGRLSVGEQTVGNYLSAAYGKLGVRNRIEAFVALGWLRVPEVVA